MEYHVTSFDVCVQGFERLRSYTETLLPVPIDAKDGIEEIRQGLHDELQSCMRPDGFDYEAATKAIDTFVDGELKQRKWPNPFGLENRADEDDVCCEPCYLFVYMETGLHQPVY